MNIDVCSGVKIVKLYRQVIESLMKGPAAARPDNRALYLVWSSLGREGWRLGGPLLPPGWRYMRYKKDMKYLTEGMVVFISSNDALKYIDGNDDYEVEAADNFKQWMKQNVLLNDTKMKK